MRLLPCPACARHVRVDAGVCPFCDQDLASPPSPRSRVGALLIGAAAISTLASCGRMAVKYGGPPAPPPQEVETTVAPAEPEPPAEPSEPEPPAAPEAG